MALPYIILRQQYIIKSNGKQMIPMQENKLVDLSFEFSVVIVNIIDNITVPKSAYMTDQLARAGTSIGANIHEAQYAQSKKRFHR